MILLELAGSTVTTPAHERCEADQRPSVAEPHDKTREDDQQMRWETLMGQRDMVDVTWWAAEGVYAAHASHARDAAAANARGNVWMPVQLAPGQP
jgi:hypothetical protein